MLFCLNNYLYVFMDENVSLEFLFTRVVRLLGQFFDERMNNAYELFFCFSKVGL
jgi:hypothetical protein